VVNVLKNDYGISVVKASRQFSQSKSNLSITGACLFMGFRVRRNKRNRAYDARVSQDQNVLDFVLEKRRRQPKLGLRLHHLLHIEAGHR
jgi:hypothetical protein